MMAAGKKGEKTLYLGNRLKYPITITKLYKRENDRLAREEKVLQYSFKWTKDLLNFKTGETEPTEVVNTADWSAPEDSKLLSWHLRVGQVVTSDVPCITVEEPCTHEVQFQGLCALCGKDMNEVSWANDHRDTERAPINMTHDQTSLTVSQAAAARAESDLQRRLLEQRKLSLVVDLDQTIIHACIEPTIGEWQRDPTNPNYEQVKEVRCFQLNDDGPRGLASGCWYYIKMRPGLIDFLSKVAKMYELHVYTMGTRAYAMNIAKIVDPEQKLFANRVISRDENGSLTAKSLQRLFPVSTNMVVIIDDRADVWPRNRPNLIKVMPYDFFKGIGDINSSFLPKREDMLAAPSPSPSVNTRPQVPNGGANGDAKISALEELASMGGGENMALLKQQAEEQEKSFEKQITDRPLLHAQEDLEKKQDEDEVKPTQDAEPIGDQQPNPSPSHERHQSSLLSDKDQELLYLEKHLTKLHEDFFKELDAKLENSPQRGKNTWDEGSDLSTVPHVGTVLGQLKFNVLKGTTIVLSGLVPLGMDVNRSEIGLQLLSFGARLHTRVSKQVTHLVISSDRPRTQKVRQALKIPTIKIVNQNWLADCLTQWKRVDENSPEYQVDIHPGDRGKPSTTATPNEMTDAETVSDVDTDDNHVRTNGNSKLKIIVSGPPELDDNDAGNDSDDEDEGDDALEPDDDGMSPIDELRGFDWGSADNELAEFLADDDDDDGDEDMDEEDDGASQSGTKRKHGDETDSDGTSSRGRGAVSKKQRISRERGGSKLRVSRTATGSDDDGSLPTPQITGDEEEVLLVRTKASQETVDDIDDDELEADMLAELDAEESLVENG